MTYFPVEVLEKIFDFVKRRQDRNAISLVCRSWYRVERFSREKVFVGNCYAVSPENMLSRFPNLRSLTLKGKPHFADVHWGGFVYPWIEVLAKRCVDLEELRLKRMVVSDDCLQLISKAFVNFKILNLVCCEGFTTAGISAIASNCRFIEVLDLHENDVDDHNGQWLSCFPESCTSLVSLNFACLEGQVNLLDLQRLVKRCPNLTSLRLNNLVPVPILDKILKQAPQLVDLGIGSFENDPVSEACLKLKTTLLKCTSIRSLSGFLEVAPRCLSVLRVSCKDLTFLNLSYASRIHSNELVEFIHHCPKLQRLWILDRMGDNGLRYVALACKDLQELKVFRSNVLAIDGAALTEAGLVAISTGCQNLRSVFYFCKQMTNAALITISKNCPNFTHFRLRMQDPTKPDPTTSQPLDEGFGAIVHSCKGLKRLSISGLLTDKAFLYMGMYGEQLETVSIAFAGESHKGLLYVLNGCKRLKSLEIKDSPVGNGAFLATDLGNYETLRSIWMSNCEMTVGGCKAVAAMNSNMNLEIINDNEDVWSHLDSQRVEMVYLYRTLVGPRRDAPHFVRTF